MGVDLRLYPVECEITGMSFSHTILRCDGQRELFDRIAELKTRNAPDDFSVYHGDGYGVIEEDAYGDEDGREASQITVTHWQPLPAGPAEVRE